MYGAILGDIIGSPYEFTKKEKTKDFPLFHPFAKFTDDTVMTVAIADGLLNTYDMTDDEQVRENIIKSMKKWANRYPNAGYGGMFHMWFLSDDP